MSTATSFPGPIAGILVPQKGRRLASSSFEGVRPTEKGGTRS